MKRASMLLVVLMLCGAPAAAEEVPAAVRTAAADLIPGTLPDRVNATPMPGMYQVTFGPQVVYLSEDGKYLLHGDLIDLQSSRNLTEDARKHGRRQVIDDLAEEDMVVFAPPQIQSTITVFTDTSCGYCVKLHRRSANFSPVGSRCDTWLIPGPVCNPRRTTRWFRCGVRMISSRP